MKSVSTQTNIEEGYETIDENVKKIRKKIRAKSLWIVLVFN